MRSTRAMIASLGAGVTLAIAASVCLFVVSTVVAFKGWPGDLDGKAKAASSELPAAQRPGAESGAAPVRAEALALPAAAERSSSSSSSSRTSRKRASSTTTSGNGRDTSAPAESVPATAAPADGAGDKPSSSPPDLLPDTPATNGRSTGENVHEVTKQTGDAVRKTTDAVAKATEPVLPNTSTVVQQTGEAVQGVVDDVGRSAGSAVDKLTGTP